MCRDTHVRTCMYMFIYILYIIYMSYSIYICTYIETSAEISDPCGGVNLVGGKDFQMCCHFRRKKIARKAGLWESALALLERADPDAWTFNEILCDTRSQNLV